MGLFPWSKSREKYNNWNLNGSTISCYWKEKRKPLAAVYLTKISAVEDGFKHSVRQIGTRVATPFTAVDNVTLTATRRTMF
jgi:hypothetical protein